MFCNILAIWIFSGFWLYLEDNSFGKICRRTAKARPDAVRIAYSGTHKFVQSINQHLSESITNGQKIVYPMKGLIP